MAVQGANAFEVELLTVDYTTTLDMLLQQKISKLRGLVMGGAHVGKQASPVQQIGSVEFRQTEGRYAPISFQLPTYTRRWVFPNDRDCGVPVDTFDLLRTIVDPKSQINAVVIAAANRFFDQLIINAAFASASTGVDASSLTTETWPATTYVVADTFGASASTGLTYRKFVEAKRILRHYENDLDAISPVAIISSQGEADLLTQQELMSRDYNDKPVVENGTITRIAGCSVVVSERLTVASSIRSNILTMPDGLYLGIWKDMTVDVDQRKDLTGHPWQLYAMLSAGATRLQLGKLIEVKAADTAGAPIV